MFHRTVRANIRSTQPLTACADQAQSGVTHTISSVSPLTKPQCSPSLIIVLHLVIGTLWLLIRYKVGGYSQVGLATRSKAANSHPSAVITVNSSAYVQVREAN